MKTREIMTVLLLIFGSLLMSQVIPATNKELSQSKREFLVLWNAYEAYCEEIVPDTISISGEVIQKLLPIFDGDIITGYTLFSCGDTVWEKPNCKEFKHENQYRWNDWWYIDTISQYIYIEKRSACNTVTKQYICMIKREVPSFEGFIGWLKGDER